MTTSGENGSARYDVHGVLSLRIDGVATPTGRVLDADLAHFRGPAPEADLTLVLGAAPSPAPACVVGLGDGLFTNPDRSRLTVRGQAGSRAGQASALYEIEGDMRRDERVTVHVPHLRRVHSPWTRSWRALAKGRLSARPEEQVAEIASTFVEPFLYYRLPRRGHALLHAAGVAGRSALLLSGASNVGKTLLALRLVGTGLAFLGDDLVVLSGEGHALPYPKRVNLERHDLMAYPGMVERLCARLTWFERRLFRRVVRRGSMSVPGLARLAIHEILAGAKVGAARPLGAVVQVRRGSTDGVTLRETDLATSSGATASNLFWEFNHQRWRNAHYHHALAYARDHDPLADEAAHHAAVARVLASGMARAKAYELQLPPVLTERHIERAVALVAALD